MCLLDYPTFSSHLCLLCTCKARLSVSAKYSCTSTRRCDYTITAGEPLNALSDSYSYTKDGPHNRHHVRHPKLIPQRLRFELSSLGKLAAIWHSVPHSACFLMAFSIYFLFLLLLPARSCLSLLVWAAAFLPKRSKWPSATEMRVGKHVKVPARVLLPLCILNKN